MLRTLIVEDNVIFRRSLKEILCARFPSMTIEEAADGNEALRKMDSFAPNVVFMDIRLPGENGFEITKKIRTTNWPGIIVVLTSHELPEYRDAAYSCGANYFLIKGRATGDEIASLLELIISSGRNCRAGLQKPVANGAEHQMSVNRSVCADGRQGGSDDD